MDFMSLAEKAIDWFVPNEFKDDKDLVLRCRLAVTISVIIAVLWVPFFFRRGPLSIALGVVLALFVLFLPFFLRRTSSLLWMGNGLVLVITISCFYRAYWDGGYNASILWWSVVGPVIAVLLIGNRAAFFWLAVNGAGIGTFILLEVSGIQVPGVRTISLEEIAVNCIVLSAVLTLTSLYLERSKDSAMDERQVEVERSSLLEQDMRRIAREIRRNTRAIHQISDNLSGSIVDMKSSADEITRTEEESSTAISQSTNTIQELSASLEETVKKMKELESLSRDTVSKGVDGVASVKRSGEAMAKIIESRQEYDTILQAITDIADSAHLLSLNAAIEAAKAGEFGKGFFVVVEEIRDLANRSNDAVIDIRKAIKKSGFVMSRGRNIVASIAEVFESVTELINTIAEHIKELNIALEEQNIGIKEIARGTEEIAHSGEENSQLIRELNRSLGDNSKIIEQLHQIAEQLEKQNIGDLAESA